MHKANRADDDPCLLATSHKSPTKQTVQNKRNEMKNAMQISAEAEEKSDIAIKSVLEMGYDMTTINSAVEQLRNHGMKCTDFNNCTLW